MNSNIYSFSTLITLKVSYSAKLNFSYLAESQMDNRIGHENHTLLKKENQTLFTLMDTIRMILTNMLIDLSGNNNLFLLNLSNQLDKNVPVKPYNFLSEIKVLLFKLMATHAHLQLHFLGSLELNNKMIIVSFALLNRLL
jgi:hypothetical protein